MNSGNIIKQTDNTNTLEFIYDHGGVMGFEYTANNDTKTYLYRRNAQGDIIALLDNSGKVVVKYVYDAWGNHEIHDCKGKILEHKENDEENNKLYAIANLNPFRYRSYYYDTETKLYYLKTRYYDPEIGRFINIDDLSYLDHEHINGLNLYAYCGNNPVMAVDPEGTKKKWWKKLGKVVKGVLTGIAVGLAVVGGIVASIATFGAATPLIGLGLAVVGGALLGFAGGVIGSIATQVKTVGWENVSLKKAWAAGGIGFIGGALTGALSFGFGKIAEGIGQTIGFALSKMTIGGLEVSKVFSSEIMMAVVGKITSMIGAAGATYVGDYLGSNLFYNEYSKDNAKGTSKSIFFDWLLDFGRWLYNL